MSLSEYEEEFSKHGELCALNDTLASAGISPIHEGKVRNTTYVNSKLRRLDGIVKKRLLCVTGSEAQLLEDAEGEIIQQLKEKFQSTPSRSEKVKILTVLAKSWSVQTIMEVFGANNYMARQAKEIQAEKGSCTVRIQSQVSHSPRVQ